MIITPTFRSFVTPHFSVAAAAVNPIALGWKNQVVVNGGSAPSNTSVTAAGTFWDTIQANSLDSQMITVNIVAPDNLTAALTPLFTGSNGGLSLWGITNSGTWTVDVNGLDSHSSGAADLHLTTGITQNVVWSSGNCGVSYYNYSFNGSQPAMSSIFGLNSGNRCLGTQGAGGDVIFDCFTTRTEKNPGPIIGFFSSNRVSTTSCDIYQANSSQSFSSLVHNGGTNSNSPGASAFYWYTFTPGSNSCYAGVLSFMALHNGLTSTQAQSLYNAVQTLRTSLGGGYK